MTRLAVALLALAFLAAPPAAEAQTAGKFHRIGMLGMARSSPNSTGTTTAFIERLHELGYVEGKNLVIEWRLLPADRPGLLSNLAMELVSPKVDVIVVPVCGAPLNAARRATTTIPIVVGACNDDLVSTGVVATLARPGGNVTGFSKLTPELTAKRLELLKEAFPAVTRVAVLWNPAYSEFSADWREIRRAAEKLGVRLHPVEFRKADDFDGAFTVIASERHDALIMFSDLLSYRYRERVVALAAKSRLPTIYAFRELPDAGGLMSYGPNIAELWRGAAGYVDAILKGARPADLPIQQARRFELVINMKTAKALGLTIPPSVLARADEVIE